jgi:CRISPR/Cas system endoribonuclease Cas6 (RAMP superfamily)
MTSPRLARIAAKQLPDPNTAMVYRRLAGSVLSQSAPNHQTSPRMARIAAMQLHNPNTPTVYRRLAGSVLSQSASKSEWTYTFIRVYPWLPIYPVI